MTTIPFMGSQQPNNKTKIEQQDLPPSEDKLKLMLKNDQGDRMMVDLVESLIKKHKLSFEVGEDPETHKPILKSALTVGEQYLQKFITVHDDTLRMKDYARKMCKTDYEVLITGATGTGKEIIAKSMIGDRKGKIQAVNCAGFPEHLIESELFGHIRGAFTGAETTKQGLFTSANEGIMFLDEIGEMPLSVQAKLLRALQEKRIRKVGAVTDEEINCKVVCATHRDLREMVKEGTFRQDLYARISTLELDILPLISRPEDIIPITESLVGGKAFLERYQRELLQGLLDISLNVRSLQQHVIRYNVLGKVILNTV